jgi:hypothetical protein
MIFRLLIGWPYVFVLAVHWLCDSYPRLHAAMWVRVMAESQNLYEEIILREVFLYGERCCICHLNVTCEGQLWHPNDVVIPFYLVQCSN